MSPGPRRLYAPRRAKVQADEQGSPTHVGNTAVDAIREEWLVEDAWWTAKPLRRRYFELVLADGRDVVVFCLLGTGAPAGGWFTQRA